ncbi:glutamate--tRNA ligase [Ferruginivarius sediminum]|uniref:Glutamate--tRNA ligase n=1 Tax=Ferruginivarius sediminum TaxID=2661937 RepID=A0A369T8J5_9PROT|nr:glutamate--tRNA ligase [Ferruginivarius sediminum]RDD61598.1 glutamate--tRNA ligase [Ferruginivarius sediminum]
MSVKVRFAPSPTGLLQVGNARIALVNWLFARKRGGAVLLRLDDTDRARSRAEYAAAIEADLTWLGLTWDEFARQSDRMDRYDLAAARLRESGRLYPCYETAEELEQKRKLQAARGRPPVYDRAALRLEEADRERLEAEGRRPHWRFKLEGGEVAWNDLVRGRQTFQAGSVSDPVLIREDGRPLYTLTSVVDDIELGVTHVMRGEDHVANTAAQVQLFQALDGDLPAFAHLPLLTDPQGRKLSKREEDLSLQALRADVGVEAMALNAYLAKLGTSDPIEVRHDLQALLADFDIGRFGRAAPKFDTDELLRLNARLLHETPFEAVSQRLSEMGLDDVDAAFWAAVRGNVERLADVRDWHAICRGEVEPMIGDDDAEFLVTAAGLLPAEPWDEETWGRWTGALKQETGRKGAKLFKPLRKALTGREHGPELRELLPVIGRARAVARLHGRRA